MTYSPKSSDFWENWDGVFPISWFLVNPFFFFFFLSGFSFTDTDDLQDSRGREGPSFIPLYYSHPLTNIQIFICNFACEMTVTYFSSHRLYLPPDCYSMRFTTLANYHLIDWWCDINFLFVCVIIWFKLFCYSNLRWETGGYGLASTIILVLQANRLTKCASHPNPFLKGNCYNSRTCDDIDMKLKPLTKFDKRNKAMPKKLTMPSCQKIVTLLLIFQLRQIWSNPDA